MGFSSKFLGHEKVWITVALAVSGLSFGQCFTSLTQSQNKLLETYGIAYNGLQTRHFVSNHRIGEITDLETKNGMIQSCAVFTDWNNNRMQIIPDTNSIIGKGDDYISNKILSEESESLSWLMNDSHHLLQKIHFDINQDGIKSIEIVEFHMTGYKGCTYLYHMIFVEDHRGVWSSLSSNDNDPKLNCTFCAVS